ncbi:MAG: hypothetical protein NT068_00150 [Candidatus Nomurabacteria bacterium]|nr:hypothetical protein [Candidatus Nomurabacteria bacterium]
MKTLKIFRTISAIASFFLFFIEIFILGNYLIIFFDTASFSGSIFCFSSMMILASLLSVFIESFCEDDKENILTNNIFRFISAMLFFVLIVWSFVALFLSEKSFYDLNIFQIFDLIIFMIAAIARILAEFVFRFKLIIVLEDKPISRERIIEFNEKYFDPNNPWT